MTIGASKTFGAAVAIEAYGAFITPSQSVSDNLPPGAATSSTITGNVTGGVGPFTFAWTRVSGDTYTINSPTNATTTFSTSGPSGSIKFGVYRFTVTDTGNGDAEEFADIDVTFEFAGPSV